MHLFLHKKIIEKRTNQQAEIIAFNPKNKTWLIQIKTNNCWYSESQIKKDFNE